LVNYTVLTVLQNLFLVLGDSIFFLLLCVYLLGVSCIYMDVKVVKMYFILKHVDIGTGTKLFVYLILFRIYKKHCQILKKNKRIKKGINKTSAKLYYVVHIILLVFTNSHAFNTRALHLQLQLHAQNYGYLFVFFISSDFRHNQ